MLTNLRTMDYLNITNQRKIQILLLIKFNWYKTKRILFIKLTS